MGFDDIFVPKYWKLAQRHIGIIKTNLKEYYKAFKMFMQKPELIKYLIHSKDKLIEIKDILSFIKCNYIKDKIFPVMNKFVVLELLKYIYYLNISILIENIKDNDELEKDLLEYIALCLIHFSKSKSMVNLSKVDI